MFWSGRPDLDHREKLIEQGWAEHALFIQGKKQKAGIAARARRTHNRPAQARVRQMIRDARELFNG